MKKQLFLLLGVGMVNGVFADNKHDNNKAKDSIKAYKLHYHSSTDAAKKDIEDGIASTRMINDIPLWDILTDSQYYIIDVEQSYKIGGKMSDVNFDGISVVKQKEDGTFGNNRYFHTFDRSILKKYFFSLASSTPRRTLDNLDHLSFVESVTQGNCALCVFGEKNQAIVTNAQGTSEEVCYLLKKTKNLEAKERRLFELRMKDSESIEEYEELQEIRKELPKKRKEVKDLRKQLLKK